MNHRVRTAVAGLLLAIPVSFIPTACATFTAGDAAAIEAAAAAGCVATSLIPVAGGLLASACIGEEPALRAALDKAVAESAAQGTLLDGGTTAGTAAQPITASTHVAVHRRTRGGRKVRVGYVPVQLADGCQRALTGERWHGEVVAGPWDAGAPDADQGDATADGGAR